MRGDPESEVLVGIMKGFFGLFEAAADAPEVADVRPDVFEEPVVPAVVSQGGQPAGDAERHLAQRLGRPVLDDLSFVGVFVARHQARTVVAEELADGPAQQLVVLVREVDPFIGRLAAVRSPERPGLFPFFLDRFGAGFVLQRGRPQVRWQREPEATGSGDCIDEPLGLGGAEIVVLDEVFVPSQGDLELVAKDAHLVDGGGGESHRGSGLIDQYPRRLFGALVALHPGEREAQACRKGLLGPAGGLAKAGQNGALFVQILAQGAH